MHPQTSQPWHLEQGQELTADLELGPAEAGKEVHSPLPRCAHVSHSQSCVSCQDGAGRRLSSSTPGIQTTLTVLWNGLVEVPFCTGVNPGQALLLP